MTDRSPLADQRILVLEDEFVIAARLAEVLADAGATVVGPSNSVDEAVRKAAKSIDAAILDINLRGEMSYDFADWLRARNVPVVFSTGYDPFVIPQRHADVAVVGKPCVPNQIVDAVSLAIASASTANPRRCSASGTP